MTSTTFDPRGFAGAALGAAAMRTSVSNKRRWAGRIVTAIPVLFLTFDFVIKLLNVVPVVDSFGQLGIPVGLAREIGTLELLCLVIYLVPRTSFLGAILLTGYLGGAVAIHVRVGDPLLSHALFPCYVGAMVWGGLFLRHDQLWRTLIGNHEREPVR